VRDQAPWLTSAIPAPQEVEIRKIMVERLVSKIPISTN
jgi:hypothetical protein